VKAGLGYEVPSERLRLNSMNGRGRMDVSLSSHIYSDLLYCPQDASTTSSFGETV
jgi:hypothetical protein